VNNASILVTALVCSISGVPADLLGEICPRRTLIDESEPTPLEALSGFAESVTRRSTAEVIQLGDQPVVIQVPTGKLRYEGLAPIVQPST